MDNQTTIGRLFGEDMISFIIQSYYKKEKCGKI